MFKAPERVKEVSELIEKKIIIQVTHREERSELEQMISKVNKEFTDKS